MLQLTYEVGTLRVIVQAVGSGEVVKRIDVASQLIARGARLADFVHLEHAYAPPYAPALDPLAVAAMAAENQEHGIAAESPTGDFDGAAVLDVRHPDERAARPLDAAAVIPLEELRSSLPPAPADGWLVVCERGTRAAEAVRLLQARGERGRYLGGGLHLRAAAQAPEAM
jgi:rhodanese-related sulfurtransferase